MSPVVKVCCIASVAEARLAVAAGAGALGLVSAMPSGSGVVLGNLPYSVTHHASHHWRGRGGWLVRR
jgi:hypothetical protein